MALAGEEAVDPVLCGRTLLQPLERLRVPGHMRGELHVEPERHENRHGHDEAAERLPDARRPRPQRLQAHPALSSDGDEEQDEPGPERVGERDEHALDREALSGGEHRDRGDHGPRTRSEEKPQANPEEEAAAHPAGVAAAERLERPLHEGAEPGPQEREPHQQDDADRDVAEEVIREPERREERRRHEREEREAADEPRHDRVRPPSVAARTAREHDRQHRQDAGRERRDDARDERDADEQAHGVIMPA